MENNELNNLKADPEQPMAELPKKKSKAPLIIFLVLLIFGAGICAGVFVPKLLKENNKDKTTENDNEKEQEPVEGTKEDEQKEYVKPKRNSKYTFVKEDEQIIKLNGKEYHLLSYYYDDNDENLKKSGSFGIFKQVYFEGELIVEKGSLMYHDKNEKDSTINDDIKYTEKMTTVLDDKESSDQYLVYFYENDFLNELWAEDEDDVGSPDDLFRAMVVAKDGNVLFNQPVWFGGSVCYLWVKNKDEVLDRYTIQGSGDYSAFFDEIDGDYKGSDYHSIYVENVNGYTYPIEFKEDHFYYFTGPFTDEGNKDYLYTIENGTLKKKLLKEYKGPDADNGTFIIDGAGQGCDFE